MLGSRVLNFTDPYSYQAAIRAAEGEIFVTARGDFRARPRRPHLSHSTFSTSSLPTRSRKMMAPSRGMIRANSRGAARAPSATLPVLPQNLIQPQRLAIFASWA
jgi:hypothetical protein